MIGQELYADRKVSIEPLFEYLKDMFDIRIVPVKGLQCEIICIDLCVGYQTVYYNCVAGVKNPRIGKKNVVLLNNY